jgi:hypothetical protein
MPLMRNSRVVEDVMPASCIPERAFFKQNGTQVGHPLENKA